MTSGRRIAGIVSSIALVSALTLGGSGTALATSSPDIVEPIPAAALAEVDDRLQAFGVSSADRQGLLASLANGETWDSMNGAEPVSVETFGAGKTIERFADGSVTVSTIEQPGRIGGISTMGVSGCRVLPNSSGWIRRADCTVKVDFAIIMMTFEADYSVKTGYGRIDAARYPAARVVGGGFDNLQLTIGRKLSSGTAPATARVSARTWVGPFKGFGASTTAWMQLNVLTSATTTNN